MDLADLYSFALSLRAPDSFVPSHQGVDARRYVVRCLRALSGEVYLSARRNDRADVVRHRQTFIVAATTIAHVLLDTALLTRYLTVDLKHRT